MGIKAAIHRQRLSSLRRLAMTMALLATLLSGVASLTFRATPAGAVAPVTVIPPTLNNPGGMAIDAAGNLFIANFQDDSVEVFPLSSGSVFGVPVTADVLTTIVSGLQGPIELAFDGEGNLYISNQASPKYDGPSANVQVLPATSGTIFGQEVTADTLATIVSSDLNFYYFGVDIRP
jgi:hypothetical protein